VDAHPDPAEDRGHAQRDGEQHAPGGRHAEAHRERDRTDLDRGDRRGARPAAHQPQQDDRGQAQTAAALLGPRRRGGRDPRQQQHGPIPSSTIAHAAACGEMLPSAAASTGEVTKVTSLRVAATPSARGRRADGTRWFSTARRFPYAAPLTSPASAAPATTRGKGAPSPARTAMPTRASVRRPISTRRKGIGGKRRPKRVIGTAPTTCAIVIASIIAAPLEALPVS